MAFKEAVIFNANNYEIQATEDLSPTLRPNGKESMHHMGGAASESVYLYYQALDFYFKANPDRTIRVLSFGFGLGYNELITVIYFLENKLDIERLNLISYEKDIFLYDLFNSWLNESVSSDKSIYDEVLYGVLRALAFHNVEISMTKIKAKTQEQLANGKWSQLGAVNYINDFSGAYDVVFYDAYSAKTNELLWSEEFLNEFFKTKLSQKFVYSTYACTAVLKRVASLNQCTFDKRDGFKGKRNSSLIYRL